MSFAQIPIQDPGDRYALAVVEDTWDGHGSSWVDVCLFEVPVTTCLARWQVPYRNSRDQRSRASMGVSEGVE